MQSVREMKAVQELSENFRGILDFELVRENSIVSVVAAEGTRCPLAITFSKPLGIDGYKRSHALPDGVETWET